MKKIGKLFSYNLVLICTIMIGALASGNDSVTVTAITDKKELDPQDQLVYSVVVEATSEVEVQPPTLAPSSDFEVGSSSTSTETSASLINTTNGPQFKTVQRTLFHWQLAPKRGGTLTIYPTEVVVNGRSYRTKALQLRVGQGLSRPGRSAPNPGDEEDDENDLFQQLLQRGLRGMPQLPHGGARTLPQNQNDAFFIQVETDKTEAFVGEQVTVSFYLYTAGLIRDFDTLKYPSLKGFWKEDIEVATHLNFQQEVVNGVPYKKALLASFALFPIKEGQAIIDSYTAKASVMSAADPFGALGMGKAYTYTKPSLPVKINVKPLPVEGRPASFTGAVGEFQFSSRVEDQNVVAQQPFPLKVRLEGRGNAKTIELPALKLPDGLELYETQSDAKFFNYGTSYKEFTVLLIPRKEGPLEVPSLSIAVFDPATKKYVTKTTDPIRLTAQKATLQNSSTNLSLRSGQEVKTEKGETAGPEFRPTFSYESGILKPFDGAEFITFAGLSLSGVLLALLALVYRENKQRRGRPELKEILKLRLSDLQKTLKTGDARNVGVKVINLLGVLLALMVGSRLPERNLRALLRGLSPSQYEKFGADLESKIAHFEHLAFAPVASNDPALHPEQLRKAVSELSDILNRLLSSQGA